MKCRKSIAKCIAFNSVCGSTFPIECKCLKFQLLNTNIEWNNFKYEFSIFPHFNKSATDHFLQRTHDSLMPLKLSLSSSVMITLGTEAILSCFLSCVFKRNLSCFHWVTLELCYLNYVPSLLLKLHHEMGLIYTLRGFWLFLNSEEITSLKNFCRKHYLTESLFWGK